MKKYEIRRHGNMHRIYERATEQYVACSTKPKRIKNMTSQLEGGAGFAGNTPKYLLTGLRYGIPLDHRPDPAEY